MILKWQDRDYGTHYLEVGDEVALLGLYGHDEPRPNVGHMYERSTFVVADPPRPEPRSSLVGEYGNNDSGPADFEWAETGQTSRIAVLFAPGYGDVEEGLLQISCLAMFLVNDRGDTIDTLVRGRR